MEFCDEYKKSTTESGVLRKESDINSIIIHTTGYGPGLQRLENFTRGKGKRLEKIGAAYAHRMANILKYKGHYLIDHTGKVWQFIDLERIAWHTGSSKRKLLSREKPHKWWTKRWNHIQKPTELPPWETSPNKSTIGIDLLAHGNGQITSGYTDEQYKSLGELIGKICDKYSIPVEREYILGHEDVDPISRGNTKRGWDPGSFDYDKLISLARGEDKEGAPKKGLDIGGIFKKIFSWNTSIFRKLK
jgi:hypothetical protein